MNTPSSQRRSPRSGARAVGLNARESTLRIASRSIWQERFTRNFSFYCPMCASPRRIGMHPQPGQPIHFAQVGLTTLVFALALQYFWPFIGMKGLVAFVPIWALFEVVYRAKVRASVRCTQCGFDPVLYLSDVDRTREAIREHWKKRFEERGIPFPEEASEIHASRYQPGASMSVSRSADARNSDAKSAEFSDDPDA